jgi:hypothetical protein
MWKLTPSLAPSHYALPQTTIKSSNPLSLKFATDRSAGSNIVCSRYEEIVVVLCSDDEGCFYIHQDLSVFRTLGGNETSTPFCWKWWKDRMQNNADWETLKHTYQKPVNNLVSCGLRHLCTEEGLSSDELNRPVAVTLLLQFYLCCGLR